MYDFLPNDLAIGQKWKDIFGREVEIIDFFTKEKSYDKSAKFAHIKVDGIEGYPSVSADYFDFIHEFPYFVIESLKSKEVI